MLVHRTVQQVRIQQVKALPRKPKKQEKECGFVDILFFFAFMYFLLVATAGFF